MRLSVRERGAVGKLVALALKDFDESQHPRDEKGEFTISGGAPGSMADVPAAVAPKIDARMAAVGLSKDDAIAHMDALYQQSQPGDKNWYADAHAWATGLASKYNTDPETVAGVAAALSPLRDWSGQGGDNNQAATETILRAVAEDKPFVVSQAAADRYNGGKLGTAGGRVEPGTYKPSDLNGIQLGALQPDSPTNAATIVSSTARAWSIATGERTPDEALSGPKTRSFYANISDPSDARYVTVDTWMYRAATNSEPLKLGPGAPETAASYETQGGHLSSIFQGSPQAKGSYPKGLGTYPWFAGAISQAAASHGISGSQYQAAVWSAEVRLHGRGSA